MLSYLTRVQLSFKVLLIAQVCLVFRKKDLYLVITQKLTFMKSGGFHADFMKSDRFDIKSTGFQVKSTRFCADFT